MDFILEGLKGVAKSTDDLLIYGKTEAEHDERVRQVLHRLEENRVTCNILKCSFFQMRARFCWPSYYLKSAKNAWLWTESHTKAFQDVKNVLSNPPVLGHYDMTKPTAI